MTLLNFQLKALRYPHTVDLANTESVRKLVIWLENLKASITMHDPNQISTSLPENAETSASHTVPVGTWHAAVGIDRLAVLLKVGVPEDCSGIGVHTFGVS